MKEEITIFDLLYPKYKISKPIRLIELFGGYGSQALALKYLGVEFEHWKLCEWATKSIQAYKDIHFKNDKNDYSASFDLEEIKEFLIKKGISQNYNEPMTKEQIKRMSETSARKVFNNIVATHNLVNISQVKGKDLEITHTDKYEYIMTYSFPCQDLSLAGKGKGMSDTSTRSGLLWEVERILSELKEKPQILLMENVPQVHSQDNIEDFKKWILRLEELGYQNYWQDLIATDFGIPQTRNRCFMVSILGDYSYSFPPKLELKIRLKDLLEDNVKGKYFLSDKAMEELQNQMTKAHKPKFIDTTKEPNKSFSTITAGYRKQGHYETYIVDKKYYLSDKMKDYIVSKDDKYKVNENKLIINRDIACSKTTREGNTRADTSDYVCKQLPDNYNLIQSTHYETEKGPKMVVRKYGLFDKEGKKHQAGSIYDKNGLSPTLDTASGGYRQPMIENNDLKIRKLTPKECFRLMGVKDEDFEKISKNQSDSSLYHLAGDSIVVNVLMAIFGQLL